MIDLRSVNDKRIRFYKLDRIIEITNASLRYQQQSQILVLLPNYKPYALLGDGSTTDLDISTPGMKVDVGSYVSGSKSALVNGAIHIFGGNSDEHKVA